MNIRAQKRPQASPFGTLIKGDNRTARVRITVPRMDGGVDLSDLTWIINITNADGGTDVVSAADVRVDTQDITMSYIAGGVATSAVGNTRIMIEGVNSNGSVWRSAEYFLRIDPASTAEPSEDDAQRLTELQELILYVEGSLNAVIEAGDRAREAYQHPPVIGDNGNWLIWEWKAYAYADSGKQARGETGAKGDRGEQGEPGVPGKDAPAEGVLYTPQTLSTAQKTQARANIGAVGNAAVQAFTAKLDTKEDAISIVNIADGAAITLANNAVYRASGAITAMNIALPETVDAKFRCAIEFACGDVAAALVYPDAIIWTGDSLDVNGRFVPLHSHRYHIDIWFDGACVRANASGVIA